MANPIFQQKRQLEIKLEEKFPDDYSSKYSLVTFNEDLGYQEAMIRGRAQDKAIINLLSDDEIDINADLKAILTQILKETEDMLEEDRVARTMRQ